MLVNETHTSLMKLATRVLIQAGVWLAAFPARTCCWLLSACVHQDPCVSFFFFSVELWFSACAIAWGSSVPGSGLVCP